MRKPLCIDLFAGIGGWTEGFLAEGFDVVGFDIERHHYGENKYPAQLVIQDVLTLHGSQFRDAAAIVASPPCQEFSYMAMPWKRGKQIAAALRGRGSFPEKYTGSRTVAELRALFDACFRIQREAIAAQNCTCGHPVSCHEHDYLNGDDDCSRCSCIYLEQRYIPLVVENVKGAEPWVGPAAWHFGSFYLWGDVPALMPPIRPRVKNPGQDWNNFKNGKPVAAWNDSAVAMLGVKVPLYSDPRRNGGRGSHLTSPRENIEGVKIGGSGDAYGRKPLEAKRREATAIKNGGDWFSSGEGMSLQRRQSSKSSSRKAASALIAKIPFELSNHIARVYKPRYAYELPA